MRFVMQISSRPHEANTRTGFTDMSWEQSYPCPQPERHLLFGTAARRRCIVCMTCCSTLRTGRKAARRRLSTVTAAGGRLDARGSTLRHAATGVLVTGFIGHDRHSFLRWDRAGSLSPSKLITRRRPHQISIRRARHAICTCAKSSQLSEA